MPLNNILRNRLQSTFGAASIPPEGWEMQDDVYALFADSMMESVADGVSAALIKNHLESNREIKLIRYAQALAEDTPEEPVTEDSFFSATHILEMLAEDKSDILLAQAKHQITLHHLKMSYEGWAAGEAMRPERPNVDHLLRQECA